MQYDIILRKLYAELKSLGLEKFATPLMEVTFPDGTFQKRFDNKNMNKDDADYKKRYHTQLQNSSEDYFIKSEQIGLEFAVHYINLSKMYVSNIFSEFENVYEEQNNIHGTSSIVEGKNLFILNSIDDAIKEFDQSNTSEDVSTLHKALRSLKPKIKYDYNIIVLSDRVNDDTVNPEWFLHDILGHTISLVNNYVPANLFPFIFHISNTGILEDARSYFKNHVIKYIIKDYIESYHDDKLNFFANNIIFEMFQSTNILSNKIFLSDDELVNIFYSYLKEQAEKLLTNLNAESQKSIFEKIKVNKYKDNLIHVEDITPTLIVGMLINKDNTRTHFENFADSFSIENILPICEKIFNIFYEEIKDIVFRIIKSLPINLDASKAMPTLEEFKTKYFNGFLTNISFEKNMINDYNDLEKLTMNSLDKIKGKIVFADMTAF